MTDVTTETKQEKKFDSEAFAMNIARAMESGGRALAAYLKPRESGEVKDKSSEEIAEVIKTLTSVAEYWLSDNERASDLQTKLPKGNPAAIALTAGQALCRSGVEAEPVLRLHDAGVSVDRAVVPGPGAQCRDAR